MEAFFNAKKVAVVGASRTPGKIGNVILKNFLSERFKGKVYPVNPKAKKILDQECYAALTDIPEKIDLAIITTPAKTVLDIIEDLAEKKIENAIIISSGFKEVGNLELENELRKKLRAYNIKCIGPNCLGVFDSYTGVDSLFLPEERLKRPQQGGISFVSQSGALGSALLDLAAKENYGFAKFVSYGNAVDINESDLISCLGNDKRTRIICLYVEGLDDGKKFMRVARKVSKKKPIIIIKGGVTEAGSKAALSHTGSIAGRAEIYFGAFKQVNAITAENMQELFDFMKIFEKCRIRPKGTRVQIITNGGGYGIICSDALQKKGLKLANLSKKTVKKLEKLFPPNAIVANPIDLLGDATNERYAQAITHCIFDKNTDILLIVLLAQVPLINEKVVKTIIRYNEMVLKPIITITTGSEYSEKIKRQLEQGGVPCFTFPVNAAGAIKAYAEFYLK